MYVQDILSKLDLGSSVAEFDQEAERHFVITNSFRALIGNRADIIAGEKGAGKTAIYRHLSRQYKQISALSKIEIVTAFNPSGSPVFQRLARAEPLSEGQYLTIWKAYILSLVGNWLLQILGFLWPGFECAEGETWREKDGSRWRTLHVIYPPAFPTHSRKQTFYFDEQGLLRRLDYTAYVFSEWTRGAHYCSDHRTFDGLVFPSHRIVYPRLPSGHPFRLFSVMEGWVEDVEVVWKQVAK